MKKFLLSLACAAVFCGSSFADELSLNITDFATNENSEIVGTFVPEDLTGSQPSYNQYNPLESFSVAGFEFTFTEGSAPAALYDSKNGEWTLRLYRNGGSMTITAPEGYGIEKIDMTNYQKKDNAITADSGVVAFDGTLFTWTGEATNSVRFDIQQNIRLSNIVIIYQKMESEATVITRLADLLNLESETEVTLKLDGAISTFSYYGTTYIQDETAAIPFTDDNYDVELPAGKSITGTITGSIWNYGEPAFYFYADTVDFTYEDADITTGKVVTLEETTLPENINRLVTVLNANGEIVANEEDFGMTYDNVLPIVDLFGVIEDWNWEFPKRAESVTGILVAFNNMPLNDDFTMPSVFLAIRSEEDVVPYEGQIEEPVEVPSLEYFYEEGLEEGTVFTLTSEVTITAVGRPEGAEESYVFVTEDYCNFLIRVEGELPEGYVNGAKISNARMVYSPIEYIDPSMGGYDMEDWAIYIPSATMSQYDCPVPVAGEPVAAKPVEYMIDGEVFGFIALSNAYVSAEDEFIVLYEDGEYYQVIPMNEEVANNIRSINALATSYLDIVNYFNLEGCFGIGEFGLALYATSAVACETEAEITIGGESKFETAQTIEITCDDENATIYYRVVKNNEEVEAIRADFVEYTEPFVINGNCTVEAYARAIGYADGQIVSKEFTDNSNTGINGVSATENAEYFNLQGVRVANPTNGVYVIRRNGVVTKENVIK